MCTTPQLEKKFLQPMHSKCIRFSISHSVCSWGLREGYRVKECFTERSEIFLSACVEGILRLFTIFYLHRKFSIFLRNVCDCNQNNDLCNQKLFPTTTTKRHNSTTGMVGKYHLKLFLPQPKTDTTAQLEKCSSSPCVASVFIPPSVRDSVCP